MVTPALCFSCNFLLQSNNTPSVMMTSINLRGGVWTREEWSRWESTLWHTQYTEQIHKRRRRVSGMLHIISTKIKIITINWRNCLLHSLTVFCSSIYSNTTYTVFNAWTALFCACRACRQSMRIKLIDAVPRYFACSWWLWRCSEWRQVLLSVR